jgi:uncharacterized protein (TIGR02265 family)
VDDSAPFVDPDWTLPLDVDERITATPETATIRGLFFRLILDEVAAAGLSLLDSPRYVAFARYPVREYCRVAVQAARALHPELPLREALFRVGRSAYPGFKATMAGAAIFAFAGDDFFKVAKLAHKAYQVAIDPGQVAVNPLGERHLQVQLREIWNFPDCLQVGVWAGAMDVCNARGRVRVRVHSASDVDLDIVWE